LQGHESWVHTVAFSPDNATIASGSGDETIRLWDLAGRHLKTLRAQRPYEGMNISSVTGLSDAQKATLTALGAVAL
jgi:WD40 repeat protein